MDREWSVNEMATELGLSQSARLSTYRNYRMLGIVSRRRRMVRLSIITVGNPKVAEILRTMSVVDYPTIPCWIPDFTSSGGFMEQRSY